MRVLLFLAVLGVVASGVTLDPANPTASAFEAAAGEFGLRAFGLVLWAAALTSVIGASYTSVSFLTSFGPEDSRGAGAHWSSASSRFRRSCSRSLAPRRCRC